MEEDRIQPGQSEDGAVFNLELSDEELLRLIQKPISNAKAHWEAKKGFNLTEVRAKNKKYWLGNHVDERDLYDYNSRYMDNRIFVAVETVSSAVSARNPQPEVSPAQSTITSIQLAKDVEAALLAYADKYRLNISVFRPATRHLLVYRLGVIKQRWDEHLGPIGDIRTEYVNPADILVDKDALPGENPRFIRQTLRGTRQELLLKFPDAKAKILKHFGMAETDNDKLGIVEAYYEIWFTFYDKDGCPEEGVCWTLGDTVVLGKMENPNWVDDESKGKVRKNFLDAPVKPYFGLNYLNLGESWIDDTTSLEQAIALQDSLNKRGAQIEENADQASGGLVLNSTMIGSQAASNLTGAPDEKLMVAGDVRSAAARMAPALLPAYVMEDKYDSRNEIDNIFATQSISRGEESKNNTLGQDQLLLRQAMGRQEDIVRAIDDLAHRLYRHTAQMMKVYYTEDHWFAVNGEDGQFDFIAMKNDKIEDGLDIKVKAGTTLALDKAGMRDTAIKLAEQGLIDPLSLYEDLGVPNPRKRVERLMKWQQEKIAPGTYMKDLQEEEFNREAFMDMQVLLAGKMPKVRDEVGPEYLAYITKFMISGHYRAAVEKKPAIQKLFVDFLSLSHEQARQTLMAMETQLPTPQDMNAANQQAAEQAGQQQQIMAADPTFQQAQKPGMAKPGAQGEPAEPNGEPPAQQPTVV